MKCLLRTKVDRFELVDSHKLSELEALMKAGRIEEVLLPVDDVFAACPAVRVKPESDRLIRNGNPFGKEDIAEVTGERLSLIHIFGRYRKCGSEVQGVRPYRHTERQEHHSAEDSRGRAQIAV